MKWTRVLLLIVICAQSFASLGQKFSEDPVKFGDEAVKLIQSHGNTEGIYQVGNKFGSAWKSGFSSANKQKIIAVSNRAALKGHNNSTFFNFFAGLAFAVSEENLSESELANLLDMSNGVLDRPRKDFAEFAHGLNFFLAGRYLNFSRNIKIQALEGKYEFKSLTEDPYADGYTEGTNVTTEDVDIWANQIPDDLWGDSKEEEKPKDDPWGDANDDPWGDAKDDPWGDANDDPWGDSNNDPWGDSTNDPWANTNNDPWANTPAPAAKAIPNRPDVELPLPHDYIVDMRALYIYPLLDGPAIELNGVNIFIETHFDTMTVVGSTGHFLLASRTYAAEGGTLKWPGVYDKMDGAVVEFEKWHFRADHDYFWTPNAKLKFNKFSDDPIEGKFEYKSYAHKAGKGNKYPIFSSNNNDLSLQLSDRAKYEGGIEVHGDDFYGKAISRKKGKLTVTGPKGNGFIASSREFHLGDSTMSAQVGELKLFHGADTISHPSVQIYFDEMTDELTVVRTKDAHMTPFHSSYFGVEINADLLKWNISNDSITMDVLNGKQEIPMTIESDNYFTPDRLNRMNPNFSMHPMVMIVGFAKKYGDILEFYDAELGAEYNITMPMVKGNIKILEQAGMLTYDPNTGKIILKDKAFHYYESSAKLKDYDWLYMASYSPKAHNAIISLDSGKLIVNGVRSFSVVEGYELEIEPDSSQQVTLLKNRDFTLDGTITEGDFVYNGKNFRFNYDQFILDMPEIDSIRIKVPVPDSLINEDNPEPMSELSNNIVETSGVLYIEEPGKKAGHDKSDAYPYFVSNSDALFYFDGREILGGAYDRSVFFVAPPFEVDSIDRQDSNFEFEGKFVSGGIFPEFNETLNVQPDQSLGFVHEIPEKGYNLYGTEARTYEKIFLNNQGIRGGGQIDFLTTQIFSEDFIYYPDSVSADGTGGKIKPGTYKGASFPEAILGAYDMLWLPRKDSMYLRTVKEPFKFYNSTAELEGFANITTKGVYGGGTMLTRGSRSESQELTFKEKSYSARHADFEILTNDPTKPAMEGDDISLDFDLTSNTALIRPEKRGIAAFSFPYAKMKTSITEAEWDLEDSVIVMTKPPNVPIEDSYFYSTREDLDSLAFSGEKATYDINTQKLKVEGIPFIIVADSKIIPEGNTTTILADSRLQQFKNAEIIIDTLNGYHHLTKGQITVISRNMFQGSAFYEVVVEADTFEIRFDSFDLRDVPLTEKKSLRMTVSGGEVPESQNLKIAPGFFYKGSVQMFAYKAALELDGHVRMIVNNIPNGDLWIPYTRRDSSVHPHIPMRNAIFQDGSQAIAGVQYDIKGELYSTFIEKRRNPSDPNLFSASGELSFNPETRNYKVETPAKSNGAYQGSTIMYNDANSNLFIEGPATFFKPTTTDIELKSTISGTGNRETNLFEIDCFHTIHMPITDQFIDDMGKDILNAIEIMGANTANDPTDELLYKLANIIGNREAERYRESSLKGYKSMLTTSKELDKSVVISGVKMKWNAEFKAWHSTSKIGLSHVGRTDLNAQLDGFMEIRRDENTADVMNLFIQAAPEVWYYISYHDKNLLIYSSNDTFNEIVKSKSNLGSEKAGELVFVVGDTNETLGFINTFRKNYFGIDTPYNLSAPSDASLEDEKFQTIEEDDDGFGF